MTQVPTAHISANPQAFRAGGFINEVRNLPEEVPIALSFGGSTYAVMMATPADFEDFAVGFILNEGIAKKADIEHIEIVPFEQGIDLQIRLAKSMQDILTKRRRAMAGPVGCGLCGIESIAEALRPSTPVQSGLHLTPIEVAEAMAGLPVHQALNAKTYAVHAAGFYQPGQGIHLVREDVGRHNALDKLAGAMAREGLNGRDGAVVITSRVSVEMVQKTAAIGAPVLIAISAPTALAVRTAEAANITLIGVTRDEEFEIFTCPGRIGQGARS